MRKTPPPCSLLFASYDSWLSTGSVLDSLSLLMKNEVLPPYSTWQGSPAARYFDKDLLGFLIRASRLRHSVEEISIG
jgi:hypothetical protein